MLGQFTAQNDYPFHSVLKISGGIATAFSLLMGLIFAFAVPSSCSVVASLGVVFFGLLFIIGVFALVLGLILESRQRRMAR